MVGIFFKEKQGVNFFIGFVIAITGVILISLSGEWEYPVIAVTRRIYFYGIILLMPILIGEHVVSGRGFVVQAFKNPLRDLKFPVFRLVCECTRLSFMESCYKLDRGSQNQSVYLCIPNRDGGTFAGDFA